MTYARLSDGAHGAIAAALDGRVRGVGVRTSGSSGAEREVLLSGDALRAATAATHERLGGPGTWLLALPPERIGGAMVVARSHSAGGGLVELPPGPFTAEAFMRAAGTMPGGAPRYTSLVPTQLRRVLAATGGRDTLSSFDAVLVGGAALREEDLPASVISTYGMTETSGGCVYDGRPLAGVDVAVDGGRILLRTPSLMAGYRPTGGEAWVTLNGARYLRTADVGRWKDGRLVVDGRGDDAINTGGVLVHPERVARAIARLYPGREIAVVGVRDEHWGERVVAVLESGSEPLAVSTTQLRAELEGLLEPAERPRDVVIVEHVPRLDSGKIDRGAITELAANGAPPR